MKVGVMLPMFSNAEAVIASARRSEELGFDGVFGFDHLFPPGRGPTASSLEVFTTLAVVASVTERVALGTLVARVGLRGAGLVAKMAAQIDDQSGGRMILGLGAGDAWDDPEARAFDLPTLEDQHDRRTQLGDTARAVRALFVGETWEGSALVPAMQGPLLPAPRRPGGPPVWLGGTSTEIASMAGRVADGWNGWGIDAAGFAERAELMRSAAGRDRALEASWADLALLGRDEADLAGLMADRVAAGKPDPGWSGTVETFAEHLKALDAAGAAWAIVLLAGPADRAQVLADAVQLAGVRAA